MESHRAQLEVLTYYFLYPQEDSLRGEDASPPREPDQAFSDADVTTRMAFRIENDKDGFFWLVSMHLDH
ncbi:hypothetical protein PROFUN_08906 [Planoprotostelium fungivorum]|uniref:Uncharacterized protein n=1 Tax=Planoprotostelium fungivorum TaxID=1890364 RepID=A0A2P6NIU2_9EUKA|nr:hypothetical protein PROFUN_08906 [Planoprotostelium fungivorum]